MTATEKPKKKILLKADSQNRVSLAAFGVAPYTKYWFREQADGTILLIPVEKKSE